MCHNYFITNIYMDMDMDIYIYIYGYGYIYIYRSGTVNSKSFVSKVLLRIKRKFELN